MAEPKWIRPRDVRRTLSAASQSWGSVEKQSLDPIHYEWWQYQRGFYRSLQIGGLFDTDANPIGFVTGYPWYGHQCFFISNLVVQPSVSDDEEPRQSLLEFAMDESQRMGFHGWVACSPDTENVSFWRNLGFSRYDDFTYRRMGYFC